MRALIADYPTVEAVGVLRSQYFGPFDLLINADVQFAEGLSTTEIDEAVDQIDADLKKAFPEVSNVFIEAASSSEVMAYRQRSAFQQEEAARGHVIA